MKSLTVISFGYLHGEPPRAHLTLDARDLLLDPHVDPALRQKTGLERDVVDHVLATPGASYLLDHLQNITEGLLRIPPQKPVTVAIGCAGGRHRSVVLARLLGERMSVDADVRVQHRDVTKPVVSRVRTKIGGDR